MGFEGRNGIGAVVPYDSRELYVFFSITDYLKFWAVLVMSRVPHVSTVLPSTIFENSEKYLSIYCYSISIIGQIRKYSKSDDVGRLVIRSYCHTIGAISVNVIVETNFLQFQNLRRIFNESISLIRAY